MWTKAWVKEFSSFTSYLHVGDNFCYLYFILFLSVLFIEDTILFIKKATASKTISTVHTIVTVVDICNIVPTFDIEGTVICFFSYGNSFINILTSHSPDIVVIT
jgi:hypothetical protein